MHCHCPANLKGVRENGMPMRPKALTSVLAVALLSGCSMVGPDFTTPEARLNPGWLDSGQSRITGEPSENGAWWRTFRDPAMTKLVEQAYADNLTLQVAGVRVAQARAQL